jgi:aconitate hydratase
MGELPLQFQEAEGANVLGLTGTETFTIAGIGDIKPRQDVDVIVTGQDGSTRTIRARCRIDTYNELEYFLAGGILEYVLRKLAA